MGNRRRRPCRCAVLTRSEPREGRSSSPARGVVILAPGIGDRGGSWSLRCARSHLLSVGPPALMSAITRAGAIWRPSRRRGRPLFDGNTARSPEAGRVRCGLQSPCLRCPSLPVPARTRRATNSASLLRGGQRAADRRWTCSSARARRSGGRSHRFARSRPNARYFLQTLDGVVVQQRTGRAAWPWQTPLGTEQRADASAGDARRGCCYSR